MLTSLRARLFAVYLGLIVIGFGGLTLFAGNQIAAGIYDEFGNRLQISALRTADLLAQTGDEDDFEEDSHDRRDWADQVTRVDSGVDADIAVFGERNALLFSTTGQSESLHDVGQSGFIVRTNAAGTATLYTSAPIRGEHGMLGYVQLSTPVAAQQAAVQRVWLTLAGGFVAFSAVGLALSLWLLTGLTRPLDKLRTTALGMAEGNLDRRVPPLPQDEVNAVGAAFNEMADRVEALVAEQRAFASNASHELRTPLTTVRLRTEALLGGDLNPDETRRYIGEIDAEVQRLGRLVDDLMLLSRLDARRMAAGEEQVDPARLLQALIHTMQPQAAARAITLHVAPIDPNLPPIQAAMNHLQLVFRNLLDNSIKYTPPGGRVSVTLEQADAQLRLTVSDSGIGIPPEQLPEIGKRFYRGDKARNRQTPGSGLGLALVSSILALYGGRLTVTSPGVGLGTTAVVEWPMLPTTTTGI